jgi:hypothetical protein
MSSVIKNICDTTWLALSAQAGKTTKHRPSGGLANQFDVSQDNVSAQAAHF